MQTLDPSLLPVTEVPLTSPAISEDSSIPSSLPDIVVVSFRPSSILKKKSVDETSQQNAANVAKPISILKRKTSQEEGKSSHWYCTYSIDNHEQVTATLNSGIINIY